MLLTARGSLCRAEGDRARARQIKARLVRKLRHPRPKNALSGFPPLLSSGKFAIPSLARRRSASLEPLAHTPNLTLDDIRVDLDDQD